MAMSRKMKSRSRNRKPGDHLYSFSPSLIAVFVLLYYLFNLSAALPSPMQHSGCAGHTSPQSSWGVLTSEPCEKAEDMSFEWFFTPSEVSLLRFRSAEIRLALDASSGVVGRGFGWQVISGGFEVSLFTNEVDNRVSSRVRRLWDCGVLWMLFRWKAVLLDVWT